MRLVITVALLSAFAFAQHEGMQHDHHADVMKHGAEAMGFDQTTTTHHFLLREQGGIVQVTANNQKATHTIDSIRMHLQHQAKAFKSRDFAAPEHTHGVMPPGAEVMKARADKITYRYESMNAGARLNIITADPDALHAVHDFLRFQIKDHQTGDPLTVK
jgi:TusA-related sulfurtransferase